MELDLNREKPVAVLLGAGSMGTAILRRVAAGKKIGMFQKWVNIANNVKKAPKAQNTPIGAK